MQPRISAGGIYQTNSSIVIWIKRSRRGEVDYCIMIHGVVVKIDIAGLMTVINVIASMEGCEIIRRQA